jgi:Holliday junction resolvase RusA-like endonuclease
MIALVHDVTIPGEPGAWSDLPRAALDVGKPLDTQLRVHAVFYVPLPKDAPRADAEKMLSGRVRPLGGFDIDRLTRLALEVLRGVVFVDERCVVEAIVQRFYGLEPRTELRVFTV